MIASLPHRRSLAVLAATALVAFGCRSRESQTTTSDSLAMRGVDTSPAAASAPGSTATPSTTTTAALTDAQIVQIVMNANSGDSANGALARTKGMNAQVKEFGQMMVRDHGGLNKKIKELGGKLNLTPEENATSRQLKQMADSVGTSLKGMTGGDFDRAYIDSEVKIHQMVLDQLDQTLIPQSQNAEVKSLLQSARPTISAHLDRAKSIQSKLTTSTTKS